jgi:gluconokinase
VANDGKSKDRPAVVVIMGVAGSGKTTIGTLLADRLGWQFADADDFHPQANVNKMAKGIPLIDADRSPWLDALSAAISNWLSQNRRVVLACSALRETYRERLSIDKEQIAFVYLRGDFQTLEQRLVHRTGHFMSAGMLASQLETLQEPGDALHLDISQSPPQLVDEIVRQFNLEGR